MHFAFSPPPESPAGSQAESAACFRLANPGYVAPSRRQPATLGPELIKAKRVDKEPYQ